MYTLNSEYHIIIGNIVDMRIQYLYHNISLILYRHLIQYCPALVIRTSQLCQHTFKHNRSLKALSITGNIFGKLQQTIDTI